MENLYKYFYSLYNHCKKLLTQYVINMGFLGFRFAFYLSQQPFFQFMYKYLFVKRPRNSNDILIEPVDTQHWLCETEIHPIHSNISSLSKINYFSLKKTASSSIYHSFDLKETYFISPSLCNVSYQKKETYEKDRYLWSYSLPIIVEDTEKVIRIIRNQPFSINKQNIPKISSISFLDIQYHHPDMKDSLILKIPKEWCCVGNELFSPAFILRMLYYQSFPFVFDMRYTLDIMDNQLNMLSLNSHQHILLQNTTYEVI
jgi:hypothetical protein